MTREEYERLLKSDYWKGYSYSLIKERNFTCEDCGRQFPNERNKLQVHHLVYRDVSPWSYRPDEVVVLCEECHRKRHGIVEEPHMQDSRWGYTTTSSSNTFSSTGRFFDRNNLDGNRINRGYRGTSNRRRKFKYVLYLILIVIVLSYCLDDISKQKKETNDTGTSETVERTINYPKDNRSGKNIRNSFRRQPTEKTSNTSSNELIGKDTDISGIHQLEEYRIADFSTEERPKGGEGTEVQVQTKQKESGKELSTLEILERKNHADVVKRAQSVGIDTSGTTLEILERMNHADVVKRARRAGVSAEGTTLEILERINHADVVKRAFRAGVDTSGSTLEILERINHADVVKQAKRVNNYSQ